MRVSREELRTLKGCNNLGVVCEVFPRLVADLEEARKAGREISEAVLNLPDVDDLGTALEPLTNLARKTIDALGEDQ